MSYSKTILLSDLPALLSHRPLPSSQNLRILHRHAPKPSRHHGSKHLYTSQALSSPVSKRKTAPASPAHQYQSLAPHYHNSVIDLYLHGTHPPRDPSSSSPRSTNIFSQPTLRRDVSSYSPPAPSPTSSPSPAPQPSSSTTTTEIRTPTTLKRTSLYEFHIQHGAKMVPFAGYSMPLQYASQPHSESHHWVRENCGLFDVGHMVQHEFSGDGVVAMLEQMTPCDPGSLGVGKSTLSVLLHDQDEGGAEIRKGGIVDDCVITNLGNGRWYMVTNAGCREKDLRFIEEQIGKMKQDSDNAGIMEWKVLEDRGLIALQGPKSVEVLEAVLANMGSKPNLQKLYFGSCLPVTLHLPTITSPSTSPSSNTTGSSPASKQSTTDYPLLISRAGYTGEDGFEISLPSILTPSFSASLLSYTSSSSPDHKPCKLAGLAARDSLRLEAGMCLYGHDLFSTTTPAEAALGWVVHQNRRVPSSKPFNGSDVILRELLAKKDGGVPSLRRRVGLTVQGPPAREGTKIFAAKEGSAEDGEEEVGVVTSGCPSPTLGKNIAMGYVKNGMHKAGTELAVEVRGKRRSATVTKMPFLPSKYWKGPVEGTAPG